MFGGKILDFYTVHTNTQSRCDPFYYSFFLLNKHNFFLKVYLKTQHYCFAGTLVGNLYIVMHIMCHWNVFEILWSLFFISSTAAIQWSWRPFVCFFTVVIPCCDFHMAHFFPFSGDGEASPAFQYIPVMKQGDHNQRLLRCRRRPT